MTRLMILALAGLAIAGCGVKGDPRLPEAEQAEADLPPMPTAPLEGSRSDDPASNLPDSVTTGGFGDDVADPEWVDDE